MVVKEFIEIAENPETITVSQTNELKLIIDSFPYFQAAHAIYLKGLKNQDSFKYNTQLKTTAAHTLDRSILFNFITSKAFNKKINLTENTTTKTSTEEKETKNQLGIGKPLLFSSNEAFSFNEWMQLANKKPIARKENTTKNSNAEEIINQFIKNNPKIIPIDKQSSVSISIEENTAHPSELMTETLAKVYLEQKKYENAIKAYEILSLKYPEKSSFFANQIKKIQVLQKHK